jgi:hypothetical protein
MWYVNAVHRINFTLRNTIFYTYFLNFVLWSIMNMAAAHGECTLIVLVYLVIIYDSAL